MRRHVNRLSTTNTAFTLDGLKRRPTRSPKRGKRIRKKRWPLLKYTIKPEVGVVFAEGD